MHIEIVGGGWPRRVRVGEDIVAQKSVPDLENNVHGEKVQSSSCYRGSTRDRQTEATNHCCRKTGCARKGGKGDYEFEVRGYRNIGRDQDPGRNRG